MAAAAQPARCSKRGGVSATLPGMPELVQGGAEELLTAVEARVLAPETIGRVPIWEGELYFEFHRGTYTSQGRTKYAHRRAEILLHEAELWDAVAHATDATLRGDRLDDAWRTLLLQQFHDILPGSSVAEVYSDTARDLASVARDGQRRFATTPSPRSAGRQSASDPALFIFNATPWARHDPLLLSSETTSRHDGSMPQAWDSRCKNSRTVAELLLAPPAAGVPPLGYLRQGLDAPGQAAEQAQAALAVSESVLENRFYRIELDRAGADPFVARQAPGNSTRRARANRAGRARQPADRLRGQADQIRRLGYRPLLPGEAVPARRTRSVDRDRARPAARRRRDPAAVPRLDDHAAAADLPRHPADRFRHRDRLAPAPDAAEGGVPGRRSTPAAPPTRSSSARSSARPTGIRVGIAPASRSAPSAGPISPRATTASRCSTTGNMATTFTATRCA